MSFYLPIIYDDFLLQNIWWIAAIGAVLVIALLIFIDKRFLSKPKKAAISEETVSLYLEALGGKDNVREKTLEGSRIILKLNDYGAVNRDKLREAGVTGFIQMSDRLTLVIKGNAMEVYDKIFPNA